MTTSIANSIYDNKINITKKTTDTLATNPVEKTIKKVIKTKKQWKKIKKQLKKENKKPVQQSTIDVNSSNLSTLNTLMEILPNTFSHDTYEFIDYIDNVITDNFLINDLLDSPTMTWCEDVDQSDNDSVSDCSFGETNDTTYCICSFSQCSCEINKTMDNNSKIPIVVV